MAPVTIGERDIDPDVRRWDADLRREASLVIGGLAAVFLLVALVYYALNAAGSGWFLWVTIAVLVVLLLAEAAVLATGIAREEDVGPPWLAGPQAQTAGAQATAQTETANAGPQTEEPVPEPEPVVEEHPEIDLQCPECTEMFTVEDTGERPLATQCPHCGAQGHVNLPESEEQPPHAGEQPGAGTTAGAHEDEEDPLAGLEEDEPPEDVETISIECPACDTQFDVDDTGERPLRAECPGCGVSGKLKG